MTTIKNTICSTHFLFYTLQYPHIHIHLHCKNATLGSPHTMKYNPKYHQYPIRTQLPTFFSRPMTHLQLFQMATHIAKMPIMASLKNAKRFTKKSGVSPGSAGLVWLWRAWNDPWNSGKPCSRRFPLLGGCILTSTLHDRDSKKLWGGLTWHVKPLIINCPRMHQIQPKNQNHIKQIYSNHFRPSKPRLSPAPNMPFLNPPQSNIPPKPSSFLHTWQQMRVYITS